MIQTKINNKIQMRYVKIDHPEIPVLIRNYGELYLADFFDEVWIDINKYMAKDKEILFKIVGSLIKKGKKIGLKEEIKMFTDDDIKRLYEIDRNISIDERYIDKSKSIAGNQILRCDVTSYRLIIDKLDYFEKICNKYFSSDLDKAVFALVQLSEYVHYGKENNRTTSCLTNVFMLKSGVCIDFSIAYWKCLERLNIESLVIKGIGNENNPEKAFTLYDHAWNQVKILNKWYNVDMTWFNTIKDTKYLFVDDETFYNDGRHKSIFSKEICTESIDSNNLKKKIDEMQNYHNIFKQFDEGKREIELLKSNEKVDIN